MGMFDYIYCKYPLPIAGANDLEYQTKDTDAQFLDRYEIRKDGSLWHEDYDVEDHSEYTKWKTNHDGQEPPSDMKLSSFLGCLTRINKRWSQVNFTGEICFYTSVEKKWIEWSAYFVEGKLKELTLIKNEPS